MVTRDERQIELIQKREEIDKELLEDSKDHQKAREKMINRVHKATYGEKPTKERIKSDSDYIDRVLHRMRFK